MLVWADGGWDFHRCLGFAAIYRDGTDPEPLVIPILDSNASSLHCEYQALIMALCMTPNSGHVTIFMDSQTVVDQVHGNATRTVLDLASYLGWVRKRLGSRSLIWIPRDENRAHVSMSTVFSARESWGAYEMDALRKRKQKGV